MKTIQKILRDKSDADAVLDETIQITFATLNEVSELIILHLKCFSEEDHIAVRFGEPFLRAAYKWFLTNSGTFVLVAKQGGRPVGFTALADRPYNSPMLRAAKLEALHGLILRPWLAFHPELVRRLVRILFSRHDNHSGDKVAHNAFIGVSPEFQGKGIGKALMNASIHVCRNRGMTAMITGVKRQNLRAKAMNEGAGFVEVPELSTKRLICLRLDLDKDNSSVENSSQLSNSNIAINANIST